MNTAFPNSRFVSSSFSNNSSISELHFKRGHSKIELEFEKYKSASFKKVVANKPILAVDIGFSENNVLLYFRTDIQNTSCIILKNMNANKIKQWKNI